MSEWFILISVLYIIYLIMKKTKTTTEKSVPKAKVEQPIATVATKAKAEQSIATVATKAKAEQPIATVATKATPKKPGPDQKPAKKAQAVSPQPVAAIPETAMPERIGVTAGSIWHYLAKNSATPVAKLVRELPEEEKIIQRSIGWLAQEGKITLDIIDRVETISLKE
jgi:hypothetical protein